MKKTRKLIPLKLLALLFLILLLGYAFSEELHVVEYTIKTEKISAPVRLAVISDLHDSYYGEKQSDLLEAIHEAKPDAVLFVGDIFNHEGSHIASEDLLLGVSNIYPCFFVTGNHEFATMELPAIQDLLDKHNITLLAGTTQTVIWNGQTITLSGVDDPVGLHETINTDNPLASWPGQLENIRSSIADSPYYSILLAHRPERIDDYTTIGVDLVLSGHTHGGQVRIPFLLNGLYATGQDFFPQYAGGEYTEDDTTMIISRGLCKNNRPRIFNRPELVIVDIVPCA